MKKYINKALEMGAKNAVPFEISDIVFDPRVILKCMFGCSDYGLLHSCPYQRSPLSMEEYEKVFKHYSRGIIVGCSDKASSQKISLEIEQDCYLDGYYFAFSLSDCGLCKECSKKDDKNCRFPAKARPAFHSVGIDVFKTVHNLGLPLNVLKTKYDSQNWYSAIFIE